MGVVWAARNESTEREVAIKLLLGSSKNKDVRDRLLREARASGRIAHRNVVEIYDVDESEQGHPFLVMQMLRGETLAALLKRVGPLAPSTAASITVDILRALIAAHAAGVVHRDLKPENVFLHQESDGFMVVKVVDFGVSKLLDSDDPTASVTGVPVGSPAYMSPEQARGARDVGPQSDMWAVGVMLFELLAGQRPFTGATSNEVVGQVARGPIPRLVSVLPGIDSSMDDLVARCLDRTPSERPTAADALAVLEPVVPPGELSSYQAFQLPPPSKPSIPAALSETVQTATEGEHPALTSTFLAPAAVASSSTQPSKHIKSAPAELTPTMPSAPDRRKMSGAILGFGLVVLLLGVALGRSSPPSAPGAGPLPTASLAALLPSMSSSGAQAAAPAAASAAASAAAPAAAAAAAAADSGSGSGSAITPRRCERAPAYPRRSGRAGFRGGSARGSRRGSFRRGERRGSCWRRRSS